MKRQILISLILLGSVLTMNAQTLYLQNGTGGIGSNTTNSNVGIGTNTPTALLELNKTEGSISLSVKRGTNSVANIGSGSSGTGEHSILQLFHNNVENIRLYTTGDS